MGIRRIATALFLATALLMLAGCETRSPMEDMHPVGWSDPDLEIPAQVAAGDSEQPQENAVIQEAGTVKGESKASGRLSDPNVSYVFYTNGNLEISGNDLMVCLAEEERLKQLNLDEITSVTLGKGVTVVGSRACEGLSKVKKITLGDEVVELQKNAIFNCPSLETIVWGSRIESIGEYAFAECTALRGIDLPETLKTLGGHAFSGCTQLKDIVLPASLISMGTDVFSKCTSLETVRIEGSVLADALKDCTSVREVTLAESTETIGDYAFKGCSSLTRVNFGSGLKEIGANAFSGCTAVESFNLPVSLEKIGSSAFSGCSMLQRIAVPENVSVIGSYAFQNCEKLNDFSFADSETEISLGEYAFSGCTALTGVELTRRVTVVGNHCFDGCTKVEKISLGSQIADLGRDVFSGCTASIRMECSLPVIPRDAFKMLTGLKEVDFVDGVRSIEQNAFSGCSGLENVLLPASVEMIGDGAFQDCSALRTLSIESLETDQGTAEMNSGLKQIGEYAFSGCGKLQSLFLPETVESIGDCAFKDCTSLREMSIPAEKATVGQNVLQGCSNLTLELGMRTIPDYAFRETSGIVAVDFADTVKVVGKSAFEKCTGITEIYFPRFGVEEIHDRAFAGCSGLTRVYIPRTLRKLGSQIFSDCEKLGLVAFEMSQEEFKKVDGGANKNAWRSGWNGGKSEYGYSREKWTNEKADKDKTGDKSTASKAVSTLLTAELTEMDPGSLMPENNNCPIQPNLVVRARYRSAGSTKPNALDDGISAAQVNQGSQKREYGLYVRIAPHSYDKGYEINRIDLVIREEKGRRLYAAGCETAIVCEANHSWYWDFYPLTGMFDKLRELDGKVKAGKYVVELYLNGTFAGKANLSIR